MGWFSSVVNKIKSVAKTVVRIVKAVVRAVVRVVFEIVMRVINLLTFWLPIQKKMRIQVMILRDANGKPVIDQNDPLMATEWQALNNAVNDVIRTYKDKCNIRVTAYGSPIIQEIKEKAPSGALNTKCGDGGVAANEFLEEAGEFFAGHLAGWNVIPMISFRFPITVFVVQTISGKMGCSFGILTDYVTVSSLGAQNTGFTMAHEIGHACGLSPFDLHDSDKNNLMYASSPRGNDLSGWQKAVVRNCRHCTFW
jgi:hypothetical protein